MRIWIAVIVAGCLASGCASHKAGASGGQAAAATQQPGGEGVYTNGNTVIRVEEAFVGKVASVNGALRYAVLDFALNPLPAVGAQLGVYRNGVKVGEVKITGPAYHSNTVGDLVAGEAQVGDDIRRGP